MSYTLSVRNSEKRFAILANIAAASRNLEVTSTEGHPPPWYMVCGPLAYMGWFGEHSGNAAEQL